MLVTWLVFNNYSPIPKSSFLFEIRYNLKKNVYKLFKCTKILTHKIKYFPYKTLKIIYPKKLLTVIILD